MEDWELQEPDLGPGRTLSDLKGAENMLDELAILKLEMVWAHLGTVIYDLSASRAGELRTAAIEEISQKLE